MRKLTGGTLAALLIVVLCPAVAQALPSLVHDRESGSEPARQKSVTVECPPGEKVRGIGGWVTPAGAGFLTAILPSPDMSAVRVEGWAAGSSDESWSVTARVACGQIDTYRRLAPGPGVATAGCDLGDVVLSTGFHIPAPSASTYMTSVVPSAALDEVTVTAQGTGTDPSGVVAVAVCGPRQPNNERTAVTSRRDASPSKLVVAGKPKMFFEDYSVILGGGAVVNGEGAFIDAFTPKPALDGFLARAARPEPSLRLAAAILDDEWDETGLSICVGHWYST